MFLQMCDRNKETNTIKNEDYSLLAACVKEYTVKPIMLIIIKAETWYIYGNVCVMS